ncbi:MAG: NADPH-dependent FMN reductase [Deltaproteobacteria bacterium RBG_13_61_14]|nr:MAG: NADPH-dependent FMN reductase [Deltaproteobacteria bacterium RBG_13_61_14]
MVKIIGLSGSLRKSSFNAGLLRAAAELAPKACAVEIASIHGIPLYNADVEQAEGIPSPVAALKDRIAAADGLLLVTPEYNNSIPGVFKNAVDWLSRPPADVARVFKDRPVGLIGASPGRMGTAFSQTAWLPVFRVLGLRPWLGRPLYISDAGKLFDQASNLTDAATRERLQAYLAGFSEFVAQCQPVKEK